MAQYCGGDGRDCAAAIGVKKAALLLLRRAHKLILRHRGRDAADFGENSLFGDSGGGGVLRAEFSELGFALAACVDFSLADAGHKEEEKNVDAVSQKGLERKGRWSLFIVGMQNHTARIVLSQAVL